MANQKITEFVLKKGVDEGVLDAIMQKGGCNLKVMEMNDGKKVEVYGGSECRAMLKEISQR